MAKFKSHLPVIPLTEDMGHNKDVELLDTYTFNIHSRSLVETSNFLNICMIEVSKDIREKLEEIDKETFNNSDFIGFSSLTVSDGNIEVTVDLGKIK